MALVRHESSLLSPSMARTNLLFIVLSKARVKIAGTRRPHTRSGARGVHLRLHTQVLTSLIIRGSLKAVDYFPYLSFVKILSQDETWSFRSPLFLVCIFCQL